MTGLLDTQAFLWYDSHPGKLSAAATAFVTGPANDLLLSVASVWEIVIKHALGKLPLQGSLDDILAAQIGVNVKLLDVSLGHVLAVRRLPAVHKDPFDRVLTATAIVEGAVLVTADAIFHQYPVTVVW